ncbi:hypothetical protein [Raoultella terrigena]|uniref:hypothetical protein n=1 Tax=Raoultella terrigena TaxID=577 RepID=UPI0013E3C556|nr:hypothetical protein [Raoultella terrigena]
MNQKINVCLLSEAINGFMKECFSLVLISCEPYGEIGAIINLLPKFAQLLINNFALIDYAAKQAALSELWRRRAWRESNRERMPERVTGLPGRGAGRRRTVRK